MKPPSKMIHLRLLVFTLICISMWSARAQSGREDQTAGPFFPILLRAWPPPTPTPRPGSVLITEVLYDSSGVEPDQEWIELYNPGDLPISLTKVWLGDEETIAGTEGMFRFPDGTFVERWADTGHCEPGFSLYSGVWACTGFRIRFLRCWRPGFD
jgi:hypothetical protein